MYVTGGGRQIESKQAIGLALERERESKDGRVLITHNEDGEEFRCRV